MNGSRGRRRRRIYPGRGRRSPSPSKRSQGSPLPSPRICRSPPSRSWRRVRYRWDRMGPRGTAPRCRRARVSATWAPSTPRWSRLAKTNEDLMATWVDSHCHVFMLDDPPAAVDRAVDAGIEWMLVPGVDLETSLQARQLAMARPDRVLWATGLHPHEAERWNEEQARISDLAC